MTYPHHSVYNDFFGRHPWLAEIRNILLAILCGFVLLGIVVWP